MSDDIVRLNEHMPGSGTAISPAYATNERSQRVKLVTIPCPAEIFDVEGAYIQRRKRVPVWMVDEMKGFSKADDIYPLLARIVPRWHGVTDPETGEALADPQDDPLVFGKLDIFEQFPWLVEQLQVTPKNR